ncbi:MAG: cupin domain-containing protein [Pseudomonadota bacterium]
MPNRRISFRQILAPMDASMFMDRFYGKRPAHIKGEARRFEHLYGWERLNQMLNATPRWDAPRLRLVRDGNPLPPQMFSRPAHDETAGTVMRAVPALVSKYLAEGATINLNEVEQLDEGLAAISAAFALALNCRSNCNLYLSGKDVVAFASHFDPTDVFVLHIAGRKKWRIYENRFEAPAYLDGYHQGSFPQDYHEVHKGRVILQPTLAPGDVLYVPGGFYHDAMALTDMSLHLTFSIEQARGAVLGELLESVMADDPLFRGPLPDPDDEQAHAAHVQTLVENIARRMAMPDVIEHIRARQKNQAFWDIPGYTLPSAALEDVYRVRTIQVKVNKRGASVSLEMGGRSADVPDELAPLVEWILDGDAFTSAEFSAAFSDHSPDNLRAAVQLLMTLGAVESIAPYLE